MTRPFLEMLSDWIEQENFDELTQCEFKVKEMLRTFGKNASKMEENKDSPLWNDPLEVMLYKEFKKLKVLVKKADTLFKRRDKLAKSVSNEGSGNSGNSGDGQG
jgi:hypothetical protein